MTRATFQTIGLALLLFAAACGGGATPTRPTPPVTPPPETPPPQPPPPAPVLGVTRVLAFGDSLTAGTTSPAPESMRLRLDAGLETSYPFKLQALVTARYTDQTITVVNAGKAGEIASDPGTRSRFNGALSEAKPEVLLLMEGANDLNAVTPSVTTTVNAVEDMVRDALARGIVVMLATIPPQRPGPGTKTTTPAVLTRYNDELRAMAAKKGAQLVDVNALLPVSAIGRDGLHPTDAGYQQLAQIFFDALKARYEKPSSSAQ